MRKKSFSNIQNDTTCHNSFSRPSGLSTVSKMGHNINTFLRQLIGSPNQLVDFTQNLTVCSICYQAYKQTQKIIRKPCKCHLSVHKSCLQKFVQNSFKQSQKQQRRYKCRKCKQYLEAEIKNQYILNRQKLCLFKGVILFHYVACILIILGQVGLVSFYLNWCLKEQFQQKSYNNQIYGKNSLSESQKEIKKDFNSNNFMSVKQIQTIVILMILFLMIIFIILIVNLFKNHLILVKKTIKLINENKSIKKSQISSQDSQIHQKKLEVKKLQN